MDQGTEDAVVAEALADAALFAAEFPGQVLNRNGDWDSEAWSMVPADLQAEPGAWELYAKTLWAETRRLADLATIVSMIATADVHGEVQP